MPSHLDQHVAAYEGQTDYELDNHTLLTWYPGRVLDLAPGGGSLLELGLGHGYATGLFSPHFTRHVVVEGSSSVIALFRSRHPDCPADIREGYFEDFDTQERFGTIVMGFVLEHVDDPVALLRRYKGFLAKGGSIFVCVPNAESLNRRVGHAAGMLPDMFALSENDHLLGHKRLFSLDSLKALVQDSGCELMRAEGIFLKPITTGQIQALGITPEIIAAFCRVGVDYPELCCGMLAQLRVE